jgi:hypothetical protein
MNPLTPKIIAGCQGEVTRNGSLQVTQVTAETAFGHCSLGLMAIGRRESSSR